MYLIAKARFFSLDQSSGRQEGFFGKTVVSWTSKTVLFYLVGRCNKGQWQKSCHRTDLLRISVRMVLMGNTRPWSLLWLPSFIFQLLLLQKLESTVGLEPLGWVHFTGRPSLLSWLVRGLRKHLTSLFCFNNRRQPTNKIYKVERCPNIGRCSDAVWPKIKDKWPLYWIKCSLDTGILIKTRISFGKKVRQ